jgi:hypothetical protein
VTDQQAETGDGPIEVPAELGEHPRAQALRRFAAVMDTLRTGCDPTRYGIPAGPGAFTCDGGAALAAATADALGLPNELRVGLYWHADVHLRAHLMGVDAADPQAVEEVRRSCMDEHHHWLVLWPGTPEAVLFDPNGPVRCEPYLQRTSGRRVLDDLPVYDEEPGGARAVYSPLPDSDPWSMAAYDRTEAPVDLLVAVYQDVGRQALELLLELVTGHPGR